MQDRTETNLNNKENTSHLLTQRYVALWNDLGFWLFGLGFSRYIKRLIQNFCVLEDVQVYQDSTSFVKPKITLNFSQVWRQTCTCGRVKQYQNVHWPGGNSSLRVLKTVFSLFPSITDAEISGTNLSIPEDTFLLNLELSDVYSLLSTPLCPK